MKGQVLKRGTTWSYVVDVGKDAEGKRKQQKRGGYRTRRDAERALREVQRALDSQAFVDPHQQTLADYIVREWLPAVCPPRLSEATWSGYRWELEKRVLPRIGPVKLQELTAAHLNRLYGTLLREGGRDGGLSPRSVQYVHAILRKALDDAVAWGVLARNPADRATAPTQTAVNRARIEMQTWSPAELRIFLEHVERDRLYTGWLLTATTGMRRGEVLGLRWQDVSLDDARLAVRQTLVMVDGRPRVSRPKTPKSRRTIDLDDLTVQALRKWKARQAAERLAWGAAWQDNGLVITRESGAPVGPDGWSAAFERHVVAVHLPKIRLHDLRHSHATILLAAGTPPKVVSERLGHTTVAFTLDTYAHVVPGMQANAAACFAGVVFGPPAPACDQTVTK